jgi:hypothetical protein
MLPDNVFRECNNELVYEEAWSRDKGQHGTWSWSKIVCMAYRG